MAERDRNLTALGELAGSPLSAAIEEANRQTLAMVREALEQRRAMLAWQPVMMGRDPTRVAFHEGLIRLTDATGRLIPARDFMAAVETDELGRMIDCTALRLGIEALKREPGLRLSVNMSARSIGYPRWSEILKRGLGNDPSVAERLILEITESSAMMMPEIVIAFMDGLQRKGISFALDDFGAGYTAFRFFRQFSFDLVKIDGQFIRNIHADPDNQVLTQALMQIGRQFDMFTVAESVETPQEAAWLQAAGIDCMQGYLFGLPSTKPAWSREAARQTA
jgi:EAL domain-containing protein (putative c-di-GMP-specific phosphodiesterase class I)